MQEDQQLRQLQIQLSILFGDDLTNDQFVSGLLRLESTVGQVLSAVDRLESDLHTQQSKILVSEEFDGSKSQQDGGDES